MENIGNLFYFETIININNIMLKFNWVKKQKEQNVINKNMVFTVNKFL